MNAKRNLVIGVMLGGMMGWALGFLRLPYLESNKSFWVGFVTCLAFFVFAQMMLIMWKHKHVLPWRTSGEGVAANDRGMTTKRYVTAWLLLTVFAVSAWVVNSAVFYQKNAGLQHKVQGQEDIIAQQWAMLRANSNSGLASLMDNLLDRVDNELKDGADPSLSPETIAGLIELSKGYKPYREIQGDSLSEQSMSPERGQLLIALLNRPLDSASLAAIISRATFSGAALENADLRGMQLSQIDLSGAYLKDADLRGVVLSSADLHGADLWGATLDSAILSNANLKRANLSWSEMRAVDLSFAKLGGANMSDAKLKAANLSDVVMQWSDFSGADLEKVNFTNADLRGVNFVQSDLSQAILDSANLTLTNLDRANLSDAELNNAAVDENWFEKLKSWSVVGAKAIEETYRPVDDPSVVSKISLRKIEMD